MLFNGEDDGAPHAFRQTVVSPFVAGNYVEAILSMFEEVSSADSAQLHR